MLTIPITTHGLAIPLRDGGLMAVGLNGLVYLPRRLGVEYWDDSDGLGGNTWSVFRQGERMYALADETAYVLDEDRQRWRFLKTAVESMAPGGHGTSFVATAGRLERIAGDGHVMERSRPAGLSRVFRLRDNTVWGAGDTIYMKGNNGLGLELLKTTDGPLDAERIEAGPGGSVFACGQNGLLRRDPRGWKSIIPEIASLGCGSLAIQADGRVWYTALSIARTYLVEQAAGERPLATALPQGIGEGISNFIGARRWRQGSL